MIKFGTGGWRAVIGDDFTRENIEKAAQGIYELLKSEDKTDKPVIIGYDRRFLSESAAKWIAGVLCANGLRVLFLKRSAPTPLIMFTVRDMGLHCGIEITASHNPPSYDGIKLIVDEGRDAPVETTEKLEAIIGKIADVKTVPFDQAVAEGLVSYPKTLFNRYIDSIISRMDTEKIRNAGLRILFDPMHGSGTYPLLVVLYSARCTIDLINENKDAYFGGSVPAPGKIQLSELADRVVAGGYDLGIALDGDGDRLGIIDGNGEYIDANKILVMLYSYLHENRGWRGPVVRNVATTHMLDKVAGSFGEKCFEVPVGFKYISAGIDEADAILGGESSGGLTVRGHIHGKDSIYAAALFVEMISATGKTPSRLWKELTERYGEYVMVEDNTGFLPEDRDRINETLIIRRELPDFGKEISDTCYDDGCRVTFTDGSFVICRFSGTEPLLRIFAEAETESKAKELISSVRDFIRNR